MDHSVLQGSTIPSPSAVKDELEPVRKTRIYEEVASQIQRLLADLLDVRKMIEPALAARAAVHASGDELARLEQIFLRQHDKVQHGELAIDEDSEFHYAIATA